MTRDRTLAKILADSGETAILDWDRLPAQRDYLVDHEHQYTMYSGGFGTGKTTALCAKIIWLLLSIPNNLGFVGRLDGKALQASTMQCLLDMLPKEYIAKKNDQKGFLQLTDSVGGSKLIYGDFKDIGDLKNLPLGFFAIDQAEEVRKEIWLYLVGRLRRKTPVLNGTLKQYNVLGPCSKAERHFALELDFTCRLCDRSLPAFSETVSPGERYPTWDMVIYRRYGFGACNPEGPSHWIFEWFSGLPGQHGISKGDYDYQGYHATAYDGLAAGFTDTDYIENMENAYRKNQLMWDRYLIGKWVEAEGLVYPGWQREQNLLPSATVRYDGRSLLDDGDPMFEWVDHGLTAPTAVGWVVIRHCDCGCNKLDYYVIDEHYTGKMPVSYHAQAMKRHRDMLNTFKLQATYLDSQAFSKTLMGQKGTPREDELYSVADEYMEYEIFPLPNQKDWDAGYNRISELLALDSHHLHPITGKKGAPHLFVLSNCKHFIAEIEQYKWKKVRYQTTQTTEEPQDGNDHHMDALNGFLTSRPGEALSLSNFKVEDTEPEWLSELEADSAGTSRSAMGL